MWKISFISTYSPFFYPQLFIHIFATFESCGLLWKTQNSPLK